VVDRNSTEQGLVDYNTVNKSSIRLLKEPVVRTDYIYISKLSA